MTKRSTQTTGTATSKRKYHVLITALFVIDIPESVAASEEARGTLDHEIWERFERLHGERIGITAIRQTRFLTATLGNEREPIYRLPPATLAGRQMNSKDMRRAGRAYMTGGHTDVFVPEPPSTLPFEPVLAIDNESVANAYKNGGSAPIS